MACAIPIESGLGCACDSRGPTESAGVRHWLQRRVAGSIRDDQHHPSWRQLRLSAARRTGVQAGQSDLRSVERRTTRCPCGSLTPSSSTSASGCRTRHSHTGRASRGWRSPAASSIAARGGLNFKAPSSLATSPAEDCSTRGWRISLPPRTAISRRWRRIRRSERTFPPLCRSAWRRSRRHPLRGLARLGRLRRRQRPDLRLDPLRQRRRPGLRPDRLRLHLRAGPAAGPLRPGPEVAADLPHFGSSCASPQTRPERSTS